MAVIAVAGLRGVPATWGGVEQQCEQLYSRLAARGHRVIIYARTSYIREDIRFSQGMEVRRLPTINTKYTEALVHTFLAIIDVIRRGADILHIYGQGPALLSPLPRIMRPEMRVFFTCGGLDWQRRKWPAWASRIIYLGELCSVRCPHYRIVVSRELQRYYENRHGVPAHYIPNGVINPHRRVPARILELGLGERDYFLVVGRLVPEKRVEDILNAYRAVRPATKLVVVGDSPDQKSYFEHLRNMVKDLPSIMFLGFQFGETLEELYSNARALVSASELEGLPLVLLEAFSYGLPCVVSDIPPHREVLGDQLGLYFPVGNLEQLADRLRIADALDEAAWRRHEQVSLRRIDESFNWDAAADQLESLYLASLQMRIRKPMSRKSTLA
jgi:glycosyltransferase involved in cell wall biosynthesis